MANVLYYSKRFAGSLINAVGVGSVQAEFGSDGLAEIDPTNTTLVKAVVDQEAALVDQEGTEEALTAGVAQTATTLSALVIRNGAGATVLNVRDTDASGTTHVGPITIAANAERVIVFPVQLSPGAAIFVEVVSGGLNATPGFLIP